MFVDATVSGFVNGVTTATVDVPANSAGDTMILSPFVSADVGITSDGFTFKGDSTFLQASTHSGKTAVLYKQLTEADSGQYTVDFDGTTGTSIIAACWSGRKSGDPFTFFTGNVSAVTTQPPLLEGVSLDGDDLGYFPNEFNGDVGLIMPDGWLDSFPTNNQGMHLFSLDNVNAGNQQAQTAVVGSDWWYPCLFALAAATAPPPTPSFNLLFNQLPPRKRWARRMRTHGR